MYQLLRVLGVLAAVVFSVGQASAYLSSVFPVSLTGGPEDVTISYSSSLNFTLADLSLAAPSTNVLRHSRNDFVSVHNNWWADDCRWLWCAE